ncbi:Calx-beta domain-containing protein [Alteromonas sp. 14N.309.X.WAT.G.H12]|uniref:Calx-beta domain-containing protein n=1 Tax=Alteromonas sp. 14N.309.X.WAT.G.H12 TaxID=3120824 RepID=UPI002FD3B87A
MESKKGEVEMQLKHTQTAIALMAMLSGTTYAHDDILTLDYGIPYDDIIRTQGKDTDSETPNFDLVIFYQNSFMKRYGEYEGYQHLLAIPDTINQAFEDSDVDATVTLKDIIQTTNVADYITYSAVYDDDGELLQKGASSVSSEVMLSDDGYEEYEAYVEKWKADNVMYVTDWREGTTLGAAGQDNEYSIILSQLTDESLSVTVHELGHNLGANHEYDAIPNYETSYAHAWECGDSYTVMRSVSDGTINNIYSNPDIAIDGVYCGDEDEADNARAIDAKASTNAQRREGVDVVGTVSLDASSYAVYEDETLTVSLTRTGDLTSEASVKVFAENDTAEYGQDFVDIYKTATFEADSATATVTFDIVNDLLDEEEETFNLVLRFPYTLELGDTSEATVYLENVSNSGDAGTFSISAPSSIDEGEEGTVTVTRTGDTSEEVIIYTTSEDGTADQEIDYLTVNEILYFKAGETSKSFTTEAWTDWADESSQDYTISLSSDADVSYDTQSATVWINDMDEGETGYFVVQNMQTYFYEGETFSYEIIRVDGVTGEVSITGTVSWPDYDIEPVEVTATVADQADSGTWTYTIPDLDIDEDEYEMEISWVATDDVTAYPRSDTSYTVTSVEEESESSGGAVGYWGLMVLLPFIFHRRLFRKKSV